jgi:hypothetical protein
VNEVAFIKNPKSRSFDSAAAPACAQDDSIIPADF